MNALTIVIGLAAMCLTSVAALAVQAPVVQTHTGGARLTDARILDNRTIMLHLLDGEVERSDDGGGEGSFGGHEAKGRDTIHRFEPGLNLDVAQQPGSFTVRSEQHATYAHGLQPTAVHRKSKVSGVAWGWPEGVATLEHTLYLTLPEPLEPGAAYTIELAPALSASAQQVQVRLDHATPTEAIHVNLVGYAPAAPAKSADLYLWQGDGGFRDYAAYVGNTVSLRNVQTDAMIPVGTVQHWQPRAKEYGGWDLTGSDVWTCDFSDFAVPGRYQLHVAGVGFSRPFDIRPDAAREPLRQSVIGFYYMRIGEPASPAGTSVFDPNMPPPRQPRYLPEGNALGEPADPEGFLVYLTSLSPDHPQWKDLGHDPWDRKDWSQWKLEGEPTNPHAFGGYSDAADWDRRTPSISIALDLLVPCVLIGPELGDDDLGIRESGNGVPDLLDTAAWAVDYWYRLRDAEGGFSYGLNNPTPEQKVAYQAAAASWMAHANAAMNAMLADAMRIAGLTERMSVYLRRAEEAYALGGEEDLAKKHGVGNNAATGADLKAAAAAFLYKLTGQRRYEDDFAQLVRTGGDIIQKGQSNQLWAYAGYLSCATQQVRPIHHPDLLEQIRRDVIADADRKHLKNAARFPSRRSADTQYGWFQTVIEVGPLMLAHHQTGEVAYLAALLLESDYSLGRNPLNRVLMTGNPLFSDRHLGEAYTSGRDDGFPGVHPGHTPYMNQGAWGDNFMSDPAWMSSRGYPAWKDNWPHGEALWDNWYSYANNEFTPQQSMAGKTALYAYLCGVLRQDR